LGGEIKTHFFSSALAKAFRPASSRRIAVNRCHDGAKRLVQPTVRVGPNLRLQELGESTINRLPRPLRRVSNVLRLLSGPAEHRAVGELRRLSRSVSVIKRSQGRHNGPHLYRQNGPSDTAVALKTTILLHLMWTLHHAQCKVNPANRPSILRLFLQCVW
jgi:hypothetical protein